MIDIIAKKIAIAIKRANPNETASIEVLQYALVILIGSFVTIFISLSIGVATDKFKETALVLFSFALLRFFSGGYHFSTSMQCSMTTIIFSILLPHIPISNTVSMILLYVSIIVTAVYAPSGIERQSRIPKKYYPALKIISILIVSSNLIIGSPLITKAFFLQALTLILGRR
ncbi:accessory gene regulator ArgB-like protein [Brevibacillus laterosporus]|uniref:Accessory gene regulator B family protein n=1 Tax=Brevibacillus laterosporus TaxID=1465 RepID=A0AAP3DJD3_BRELA|nr:accessory gene regulator B family protein [Brevibacillus laterosporus]MCR8981597.1 accessory gene regulator B family protein [Brevibacillus laterosporus]MCZ0808752.1 accessory gene regulator B family protein [Brevibacillus laterosporus]MCZ0827275.1 accessory gene regulator B family protein [Brevibacillus laterosporus]MCZ0851031.1 accessory gene regulator B family protein [Brevibacillus laterosporus]